MRRNLSLALLPLLVLLGVYSALILVAARCPLPAARCPLPAARCPLP